MILHDNVYRRAFKLITRYYQFGIYDNASSGHKEITQESVYVFFMINLEKMFGYYKRVPIIHNVMNVSYNDKVELIIILY